MLSCWLFQLRPKAFLEILEDNRGEVQKHMVIFTGDIGTHGVEEQNIRDCLNIKIPS